MLEGRTLSIAVALNREDAEARRSEGEKKRQTDSRNLYLLREGHREASGTEGAIRKESVSQRKALLDKNPSLHLSLTRLAVRNVPRSVDAKRLKELARQAVVEFGTEVKAGKRAPLTQQEKHRDNVQEKGGIVRQAKIVLEKDGSRSRGYGFIEYKSHRLALMGLRWLNGRSFEGKSLIVEFAIENVAVVKRREDKETMMRQRATRNKQRRQEESEAEAMALKLQDEAKKREEEDRRKSTLGARNPKAVRMIAKKRKLKKSK
jgi:nucleolar protein 4